MAPGSLRVSRSGSLHVHHSRLDLLSLEYSFSSLHFAFALGFGLSLVIFVRFFGEFFPVSFSKSL